MEEKLILEYDKIGDILHISKCKPYAAQESDEIDELVVGRFNPDTNDLEGIEIIRFMARFKDQTEFVLPITADFKLAVKADA
jgi:hypothetical protein